LDIYSDDVAVLSFSGLKTTEGQQRFCRRVSFRWFRSGNLIPKAPKETAIEFFPCRADFFKLNSKVLQIKR